MATDQIGRVALWIIMFVVNIIVQSQFYLFDTLLKLFYGLKRVPFFDLSYPGQRKPQGHGPWPRYATSSPTDSIQINFIFTPICEICTRVEAPNKAHSAMTTSSFLWFLRKTEFEPQYLVKGPSHFSAWRKTRNAILAERGMRSC